MAATLAPPAEPTMLAVAIAKLDDATLKLCLSTTIDRDERHAILQDITTVRLALRTQQNLTRRGAA